TNYYATAARTSNGQYVVVYMPSPRTVTIDMTKLAGSPVTAKWYNPASGNYTTIGTNYSNTGSQSFTPPAATPEQINDCNDADSSKCADWALLLSTTSGGGAGDTLVPSTPTGLSAAAVSSSGIDLSWSASTDNVGVTGYNVYRCQGAGCTP